MPSQRLELDCYWDMGTYYIDLLAENGDDFLVAHGEVEKDVKREAASMLRRLAEKIDGDE